MMHKGLVMLVKGYRYTISPLLGRNCRFEPSCSEYAIEALQSHGSLRGGWLSMKRVCSCHPWHPGGYDPVPLKGDARPLTNRP